MASLQDPFFGFDSDLQPVYGINDDNFLEVFSDSDSFWDDVKQNNQGNPEPTTTPYPVMWELPVDDNAPEGVTSDDQETNGMENDNFTGFDSYFVPPAQEQVQPEPPRCFQSAHEPNTWPELSYVPYVNQAPQYVPMDSVLQTPQYDQAVYPVQQYAPLYDQAVYQIQPMREAIYQVPRYDPVPQYDQAVYPVQQYDQVPQYEQAPQHMREAGNVLAVEPYLETGVRVKREKRKIEDELPEEPEIYSEGCIDRDDGEDDPTGGFKLPASKSPIMEAMVYCALKGWGIDIVRNSRGSTGEVEVTFQVTDFEYYYRASRSICSKQRPTDDVGSRVKSLRRWFVNFPKKKDRNDNAPFLLDVKPNIAKKVSEIIERNTRMIGLNKRRRRQ